MFRLTSHLLALPRFEGSVLINIVRDVLVDGTVVLGVWAQAAAAISRSADARVWGISFVFCYSAWVLVFGTAAVAVLLPASCEACVNHITASKILQHFRLGSVVLGTLCR